MNPTDEKALDTNGLPCNLDVERFVLGSILMDDSRFVRVAGVIDADDFSLAKHRRIFQTNGGPERAIGAHRFALPVRV
jgi:hypothetical protein